MKMKGMVGMLAAASLLVSGIAFASSQEALKKIADMANAEFVKLGTDPAIVAAVKAENAKGKSLDQIKATDKKWMGTAGVDGFMKGIMENAAAQRLKALQKEKPYLVEIFVMDNQGANVAMTNKTSDYWQGDEAKFKKSFNGGSGAVFVDKVKFDDSTQAYTVQVSVPVKDGGKVIGAMTLGVDVEKVK